MRIAFIAAIGGALLAIWAIGPVLAHEGHDHGDKAVAPLVKAASRADATSDQFELVAVVRGLDLEIFLDTFATNEPIEAAVIEVETPAGPAKMAPVSGQPYRLSAPWLSKPGAVDLIFTVTANGVTEILPVTLNVANLPATASATQTNATPKSLDLRMIGAVALAFVVGLGAMAAISRSRRAAAIIAALAMTLVLSTASCFAHEGHDHGDAAPKTQRTFGDVAERLPDGGLFVPKAMQRIFGIRTVLTSSKVYRRQIELPGRIVPDPNASGFVQAAVGGRLTPPPGGFPRLGTTVKKGDVLAYVTPPLQAIDVSDMRQRRGELDQQISIVERRLGRFEQLAPSGAVARSQLEETRLELEGLKGRRTSLEKSQREPEELVAPVSGVVADGSAVAGQIVQPSAVVFHIVDPTRLWVEALSFEPVGGAQQASATTGQGVNIALEYRGSGFADRNQSLPVHFAITGDMSRLRIGQFVSVLVSTDEEKTGVAIPRTSLVRSANGTEVVFEHNTPETFTPRQVRVEPLDALHVLVSAGLEPGKRIVTQGSELLDHVR